MKSYVKVPMLAAVILEALVLLISLLIYFGRDRIISSMLRGVNISYGSDMFPVAIVMYIIMLIVYIIFMLVMSSYEGSSSRTVGNVMLTVWIIINIAYPYITSIQSKLAAGKGTDFMAALSVLNSQISMYASPLTITTSALTLLAIGRFSVENEYREAAPVGIDPAVFGQGYTPVQGYMPVQGNATVQGNTAVQGNAPVQGYVPGNDQQGQ